MEEDDSSCLLGNSFDDLDRLHRAVVWYDGYISALSGDLAWAMKGRLKGRAKVK